MIDFGTGKAVPYADLLEELITWISEDADALGCLQEVKHARTIATTPFSATGRTEQSWFNQLAIGHPNFWGITPKAPMTSAAFHRSGQCAHDRPL